MTSSCELRGVGPGAAADVGVRVASAGLLFAAAGGADGAAAAALTRTAEAPPCPLVFAACAGGAGVVSGLREKRPLEVGWFAGEVPSWPDAWPGLEAVDSAGSGAAATPAARALACGFEPEPLGRLTAASAVKGFCTATAPATAPFWITDIFGIPGASALPVVAETSREVICLR